MTIWKSILITTLLLLIEMALGILLLSFKYDLVTFRHVIAISESIPLLLTYTILLIYFRYSKQNYSLISDTTESKNGKLVLIIISLAFGQYLFDLPFWQWRNLSNKYLGTSYIATDFTDYKFQAIQIYQGFSAIIIAPLFEEIIFRYYIFGGLLKKYKLSTAMLTSSILFSLMHLGSPRNLIPTFIFGLISSIIYFRTKKLKYSILLHFIANSLWFITILFDKEYHEYLQQIGLGSLFWMIFLVGTIILSFGLKKITTANIT